ncbi:serine hydrolase domain-containing protein [Chloroflexota bacterium]
MAGRVEIQGYCDDRFASVKRVFADNFEYCSEVGASFAATVAGEVVADLWGGYADEARTRPWEEDTIVNVFSSTKVIAAVCALVLVDRGQLNLDEPVATYWPEFAQAGKEKIPVRYLLSHTSGVAGFEEPITTETLYDWELATGLLARQAPWWEPGAHSGYHSLTHGYLLGEVVRRVTGKTIGTFLREEVAGPLNAGFYIGLPEECDNRVADVIQPAQLLPGDPGFTEPEPGSIRGKVMANPARGLDAANDVGWRRAEIPAANGHGNARAIARIGTALACGGELDGVRLLGMPTIEKMIEGQSYGADLVLGDILRFGLGVELNCRERYLGPNPRTFSWGGAGGSMVVVDLDARACWAYTMNRMGRGAHFRNPRNLALSQAFFASLK